MATKKSRATKADTRQLRRELTASRKLAVFYANKLRASERKFEERVEVAAQRKAEYLVMAIRSHSRRADETYVLNRENNEAALRENCAQLGQLVERERDARLSIVDLCDTAGVPVPVQLRQRQLPPV